MNTHGRKTEVSEILDYITIDGSIPPNHLCFYILFFLSSPNYFPKGSMIIRGIQTPGLTVWLSVLFLPFTSQ